MSIPNVTGEEAPVAMIVHDLQRYSNGIVAEPVRYYNDNFYMIVRNCDMINCEEDIARDPYSPEMLAHHISGCYVRNLEEKKKMAAKYMIIDGLLYRECGEPRYVVMTFGLGHNHGGTSLMIDQCYNANISYKRYFSALQYDEAVKEALRIAEARGDTDFLSHIKNSERKIEVLLPETVKVDPKSWGCAGDEFINMMNGITESADSAAEAGILAIAATFINQKQR